MEHPTDLLNIVFIYGTSHRFTYNCVYLWNIPQIYLYGVYLWNIPQIYLILCLFMEHPTDLLNIVFIYGTSYRFTYYCVYLWNIPQIYLYLCLFMEHPTDLLIIVFIFSDSSSRPVVI